MEVKDEDEEVLKCPECAIQIDTDYSLTPTCEGCGKCSNCCPRTRCSNCEDSFEGCSREAENFCSECNYCHSCHIETYWSCEDCGDEYCGRYANDHRGCSDCYTCENCSCQCGSDSSDNVFDYGANVVKILGANIPSGVRTYGIELEFEAKNESSKYEIAETIRSNPILSKNWLPKEDGSLSNDGVEVVSVPMTLDNLRIAIKELFEIAHITNNVRRSGSCGTHVHVGRDSIGSRTIARAWAPWAFARRKDPAMVGVLHALAGRAETHWAAWNCQSPVSLRNEWGEKVGRVRLNDHYSAISTSSHFPTYEWRMFAGATRLVTALRYLETVDCLLSIAEETHGLDVCFKANSLLAEIGKRVERYPAMQATYQNPKKQMGKFFDVIDGARKGTPRKLRAVTEKVGVHVQDAYAAYGPSMENTGIEQQYRTTLKNGLRSIGKKATPPPRGIYFEVEKTTERTKMPITSWDGTYVEDALSRIDSRAPEPPRELISRTTFDALVEVGYREVMGDSPCGTVDCGSCRFIRDRERARLLTFYSLVPDTPYEETVLTQSPGSRVPWETIFSVNYS